MEAVRECCVNGNLKLLQILSGKMHEEFLFNLSSYNYDLNIFDISCEYGHLHICQFLQRKFKLSDFSLFKSGFFMACENKHYDICFWMKSIFDIKKKTMLKNNYAVHLLNTICLKKDFKLVKWILSTFDFKPEEIMEDAPKIMSYSICGGNIELCEYIHDMFNLSELQNHDFLIPGLNYCCKEFNYDVVNWVIYKFKLSKAEIWQYLDTKLYIYCIRGDYNIISIICNIIGLTEEEYNTYIKNICGLTKKEKMKLLECYNGFGSFTKPVKF
jgi:hypothetical protein